jgi:hypothetical protein
MIYSCACGFIRTHQYTQVDICWRLKNVSNFDLQVYGSLVAFFPSSTTQSIESVEHVQHKIQSNKAESTIFLEIVLHLIQ